MTWLMTHMWIVAVSASAVALLLGWSIRGMLLSGKMRQAVVERDMVKVELGNTRDEVEKLFAQIRKLQNGDAASAAPAADPILTRKVESLTAELARKSAEIEALKASASAGAAGAPAAVAAKAGESEESLVWRNRHLQSRLAHLEAELAKAQSAQPAPATVADAPAAPAVDTAKLEWEVKYLRTRVEALQNELAVAPVAAAAAPQPVEAAPAPAADPASPVEEELASLRWRVRYLEGKLAYFEGDEDAAEGEDAADSEPGPKSAAETILGQLEAADEAAEAEEIAKGTARVRPAQLEKPFTQNGDDLTLIGGIGPKIQELLNDLGIFHFKQIAAWTPENVAWVDDYLSSAGRITREGWVEQARVLAGEAAEA
jgi:predicted flap endonuclease-1-like 5' DNA nuclease/polyhydroxyalkanoate synthesis regulator phasin